MSAKKTTRSRKKIVLEFRPGGNRKNKGACTKINWCTKKHARGGGQDTERYGNVIYMTTQHQWTS